MRIASDVLQAALSTAAGVGAGVLVASTVGAPVVVAFIVVVAVGFAVGVLLTEIDRRYQLTDRVRARMMAYEEELGRDWPKVKAAAAQAGQRAVEYGREAGREIKAEAYKVDRFFASAADMMKSDGIPYWYGL